MNPVYQITAQLDTLSSMASKWPPFGTKLGILPLAPKCTQHTKFQTIWTIGIDFGIWGIFVLVGKLLMHIPLFNAPKLQFFQKWIVQDRSDLKIIWKNEKKECPTLCSLLLLSYPMRSHCIKTHVMDHCALGLSPYQEKLKLNHKFWNPLSLRMQF